MNIRCEVEARVVEECPWYNHRVQRTNGRCWFCNLTPAEAAERKAKEDTIEGGSMETTEQLQSSGTGVDMEPVEQLQSSGTGVDMEPVEPTDEELLAGIPDKPEGAPDCFGECMPESEACNGCGYVVSCEQAYVSGAYITGDGTGEALPPLEGGVLPGECTVTFEDGSTIPFGHIDTETGEFVWDHPLLRQPTLDPTIFPATERRDVPMVKVGFSGSVELTQDQWEAYCDQGLEPGRVVKVTLTGYLPDPHARWVKRSEKREDGEKETWWEQEGAIKIKALELGSVELRGFYDGE